MRKKNMVSVMGGDIQKRYLMVSTDHVFCFLDNRVIQLQDIEQGSCVEIPDLFYSMPVAIRVRKLHCTPHRTPLFDVCNVEIEPVSTAKMVRHSSATSLYGQEIRITFLDTWGRGAFRKLAVEFHFHISTQDADGNYHFCGVEYNISGLGLELEASLGNDPFLDNLDGLFDGIPNLPKLKSNGKLVGNSFHYGMGSQIFSATYKGRPVKGAFYVMFYGPLAIMYSAEKNGAFQLDSICILNGVKDNILSIERILYTCNSAMTKAQMLLHFEKAV